MNRKAPLSRFSGQRPTWHKAAAALAHKSDSKRIGLLSVGDGGLVVELTIVGDAPNERWRRGWPEA
jgi:hypothetical protein